jgi:two-component system CheB/CheR fusion protein
MAQTPDLPDPPSGEIFPSASAPAWPRFPVVGIGASAGGLDALKKLFAAMPPESGMAFVVVPHLDPAHESLMAPLLAKCTAMPVIEAQDGRRVEVNHVYVIPPDSYLGISAGVLHLTGTGALHSAYASLDWFLRSLAQDQGEHAICIILSGTGSSGTLGLKAIKSGDGAAFAQDPTTAEFPQMPESAIATGLVDEVLPVERMPEALIEYARRLCADQANPAAAADETSDTLDQILALVDKESRIDLRGHRSKTLMRRIQRRMNLARIDHLPDYLTHLREHRDEVARLAKDFLISVTQFFRDPQAFQVLEAIVIPELLGRKSADQPVRVWVPGCATGEEPYSIAMLFLEQISALQKRSPLKIFASDIDQAALSFARAGIYPSAISADVGPARLEKFFTHAGGHFYQINKPMRESVIFTVQDVVSDVPFSKMDLISCRNLLIYLDPEVQEKIVALFHFALNEGGYLLLGPTETVGRDLDLFEPVSRKWRVYRRIGSTRYDRFDFPLRPGTAQRLEVARLARPQRDARVAELMQRALLEAFAPASVLVNRKGEVLYFFGPTLRFLDLPTGEPTQDVLTLAREGLRAKLRTALQEASRNRVPVTISDARIQRNGVECPIRATVRPLSFPREGEELLLVSFENVDEPSAPVPHGIRAVDDESLTRQLEFELAATRHELEGTIEQMQTANEEIQSANEELETSKEELQSLNEELSTANVQLQEKVTELERVNADLSNLISSSDSPTVFLDTSLRIRWFAPASTKLFSLIHTDIGRPFTDIATRVTDPDLVHDAERVLETFTPVDREVRSAQGEWWLRRVLPYRTRPNQVEGVVVAFADVTAIKLAAGRERRLATLLLDSNDAILIHGIDGKIAAWNRGAERMYGYSEAEALQMDVVNLVPEDLRAEERARLEGLRQGQLLDSRETQRVCKDGTIRNVWLTATALRDEEGKVSSVASTERDLAENKTSAKLQYLATHDALTGLPNRILMVDLASHALAQARRQGNRVALLFIDLDRFKTVNDSLGHHAGDRLLQAVAGRLRQVIRSGDTVMRQGGDEFIVILSDIASPQDAANVAEKICHEMSIPYVVEGMELISSASVGISLFPDDAGDVNTLLRNSDAAMYRAKAHGRNTYQFFTADMNVGALERLSMVNSLRAALERRQVHLEYQPQVDLASGRVIGVEALMRWEHPDLGAISPDRFIPLAEESGLIVPLGEWGLIEACRQARAWQQAGLPPLPVAVNVSAIQFRQPRFPETVAKALRETGLAAQYLELELTESVLMQHAEAAMASLQNLRALGVRLSIDDFGTGYSSLGYLRRFPIHRLKIDVSFMRDVTTDAGAAAITNAIIAMGRSLKLRVLAEGVETREHLALLQTQGCDEMQGYYFCRPLPADELAKLLREGRTLRY